MPTITRFIRQVDLRELQPASFATSLQRFEQELNCLRAGLSQSEQYSVFNLANSRTQAEFIMLHLSWNQCFCDLYRQFLSGYSEAAPTLMIAGIPLARRQALQRQCEEHAEANIQMVTDFWNNCSRNSILERDTAVCAAESARIILFLASISSNRPTMEAAIRKANMCLSFITHFFSHSEATKALVSISIHRITDPCHMVTSCADLYSVTNLSWSLAGTRIAWLYSIKRPFKNLIHQRYAPLPEYRNMPTRGRSFLCRVYCYNRTL